MPEQLTLTCEPSVSETVVCIDRGILHNEDLKEWCLKHGSRTAIITDHHVLELIGNELHKNLLKQGVDAEIFSFPPGEENKTRKTKETIESQILARGFGRDTCIVAVGGGVVTDLAGFLAATFCRGVPFLSAPTTLLGMVDASLGGKNGVNTDEGKNLIGTVYHPKAVMMDTATLATLPMKEVKNGFSEMIKHGVIADQEYFDFLASHVAELSSLEGSVFHQAIRRSCMIKQNVVRQDEKETGCRRILNFGHTIGHALERSSHYRLSHGQAVAAGMIGEARLACDLGILSTSDYEKILSIIRAFDIDLNIGRQCHWETVVKSMEKDKKSSKGKPRFVLPNTIGAVESFQGNFCTSVPNIILDKTLQWMRHDLCRNQRT